MVGPALPMTMTAIRRSRLAGSLASTADTAMSDRIVISVSAPYRRVSDPHHASAVGERAVDASVRRIAAVVIQSRARKNGCSRQLFSSARTFAIVATSDASAATQRNGAL